MIAGRVCKNFLGAVFAPASSGAYLPPALRPGAARSRVKNCDLQPGAAIGARRGVRPVAPSGGGRCCVRPTPCFEAGRSHSAPAFPSGPSVAGACGGSFWTAFCLDLRVGTNAPPAFFEGVA